MEGPHIAIMAEVKEGGGRGGDDDDGDGGCDDGEKEWKGGDEVL